MIRRRGERWRTWGKAPSAGLGPLSRDTLCVLPQVDFAYYDGLPVDGWPTARAKPHHTSTRVLTRDEYDARVAVERFHDATVRSAYE